MLCLAMTLAHADAKQRGFKMRNAGSGVIDCPVCKTGKIVYSVASVNGHLWGRCSTKDCVFWME